MKISFILYNKKYLYSYHIGFIFYQEKAYHLIQISHNIISKLKNDYFKMYLHFEVAQYYEYILFDFIEGGSL